MRWLARWAGVLAAVAIAGCAHHSEAPPVDQAAAEERARRDLGPDPFRELDAGAPEPQAVSNVHAAPAAPDPRATDDAALRALVRGSPADCAALHASLGEHPAASPAAVREVLAAAERCEERSKALAAARETTLAQLLACGPEAVERCRTRALAQLKRLAQADKANPQARADLQREIRIEGADACVAEVEAKASTPAPLDGCLAGAKQLYEEQGDALMQARVAVVHARHALAEGSPETERALTEANQVCTAARCAGVRSRALELLASWASGQKRPELVLQARLQQDQLAAEALPPERRPYARSARVDAACAAVDAAKGAGSCRALEKSTTGAFTFHDWSTQEVKGDLPRAKIMQANDDFGVTLQDCFRDEATRLPVPSSAQYRVRWMVTLDGRADQVHLDPPADDSGPLAQCLREKFAVWRYPRSHGENQHVEQGFTVTATSHW